jgi:hypothetical protein
MINCLFSFFQIFCGHTLAPYLLLVILRLDFHTPLFYSSWTKLTLIKHRVISIAIFLQVWLRLKIIIKFGD